MDFQFYGAEKAAVVLDIGSRFTKCGFAGESSPRRIFPTVFSSQSKKLSLLSFLTVHSESRTEWLEAVENLLHDIYYLFLQCNPRERRVIICENLLSPAFLRESLAYVLLEKYQVIAVTFVYMPVVSLVPLLQTTALVVDLGFSETRVVPVYAGVGLTGAMVSSQKCSRTIYQHIANNISSSSPSLSSSLNLDINILVRTCFMKPKNEQRNVDDALYPIDATTKVVVPGSVRGSIASVLLSADTDNNNNADIDDTSQTDLPSLILMALSKSPGTTRKGLGHQLLLTGGLARLPGFARALVDQLNASLASNADNPNYKFKELLGLQGHFDVINFSQTCPPSYLGWLGGSIVGTLDQYGHKITKESYTKESKIIPDWMNLKTLSLTS